MKPAAAGLCMLLGALCSCAPGASLCRSADCLPIPGTQHTVGSYRLHAAELGPLIDSAKCLSGGRVLVFLHGIPTSSYLWRNVQRELAACNRTIAVDLAGLGESRADDPQGLNITRQAEALRVLFSRLDLQHPVLIAHDVGGGLAQAYLANNPSQVSAVVLVDAALYAEYWPVPFVRILQAPILGELASLFPARSVLYRKLRKGLFNKDRLSANVFPYYYKPLSTVRKRLRFVRFLRRLEPAAFEQYTRANASLRIPSLIVWGERDVYQPIAEAERLARDWPHARLVVLRTAGHFLPEEKSEALAELIERFCRTIPAGSRSVHGGSKGPPHASGG